MRTQASHSQTKAVKMEIEQRTEELNVKAGEFSAEFGDLEEFVYSAMPNTQLFMRLGFNERNNRPYVPQCVKYEVKQLNHGISALKKFVSLKNLKNEVHLSGGYGGVHAIAFGDYVVGSGNFFEYRARDIDIATNGWFNLYLVDNRVSETQLSIILSTLLIIRDRIELKTETRFLE